MKNVGIRRKTAARQKLASSKVPTRKTKRVLGLNASKEVDGTWYYDLSDMETVVAAVLAELDSDPGAGITLETSDTGILLKVVDSEGEEYDVDVDLGIEGDETEEEGEDDGEE